MPLLLHASSSSCLFFFMLPLVDGQRPLQLQTESVISPFSEVSETVPHTMYTVVMVPHPLALSFCLLGLLGHLALPFSIIHPYS